MKAVIAGAGIGGLSAAIALVRSGWQVQVLERAPSLGEIGAGVQISPNGVKLLDRWGVMPRLEAVLFEPEVIELRGGTHGKPIFSIPIKQVASKRWGARYIQVHRADLVQALYDRLVELTGDVVRFGVTVNSYDGGRLITDHGEFDGDLVIGADGIHSALRGQMHGADAPRFTGNYAWRALVPREAIEAELPNGACIWALEGCHAVTTKVRSGNLVNFVGIVETAEWGAESWKSEGQREKALADFANAPEVLRQIIAQAKPLYRWALLDRAPLAHWSEGPVTLLGDAAHPMLPSMAQGAVQAMEDAAVLAKTLQENANVSDALVRYEALRKPRATAIQQVSAKNLTLFHKRGFAQTASFAALKSISAVAPSLLVKRNDWIYGWEP